MKNIFIKPTKQLSRIHKNTKDELILCDLYFGKDTINGQHLYIVSNDEINESDWVYSEARDMLFKVKSKYNTTTGVILIEDDYGDRLEINESDCKKVILTTDKKLINDNVYELSDGVLSIIINNNINSVDIKKEYLSNNGKWKTVLLPSEWEVDTKVRFRLFNNVINLEYECK